MPEGYDHYTAADAETDATGHDPDRMAETTFNDRYAQWEQAGKPGAPAAAAGARRDLVLAVRPPEGLRGPP